jgi:hypothetical protein
MKIYAAQRDDINESFVWLEREGLPPRCIVRITFPDGGRSVFCEALQFDKNFLEQYNQVPRFHIDNSASSIVISQWYRERLGGLETQKDYSLEVSPVNSWYGKLRSCKDHPQIVVRVALYLGLLSVLLGFIGLALGIVSLWPR